MRRHRGWGGLRGGGWGCDGQVGARGHVRWEGALIDGWCLSGGDKSALEALLVCLFGETSETWGRETSGLEESESAQPFEKKYIPLPSNV